MSKLLYVSAQPDVSYFHWQVEVYVNNFVRKGIPLENIHVLFGIPDNKTEPSVWGLKLKERIPNVYFYKDDRTSKHYIPSIKPYLIYQWLKEDCNRGELFFLHDSDIIFRELPDFTDLISDNKIYMSDTKGYIGFEYLTECSLRYEKQHPNLERNELVTLMCDTIGVNIDSVIGNKNSSGGAQYIFKNQSWEMWYKIYKDSIRLFDNLNNFQKKYPINPGEIQFWTSEMWSVLWNMWYWGFDTEITNKLNFCWATDNVEVFMKNPILHMAGITVDDRKDKFYKGEFINKNPIEILKNNPNHFSYVNKNNSTIKYVDEIKNLIKKLDF
jgi:hypothetical protein